MNANEKRSFLALRQAAHGHCLVVASRFARNLPLAGDSRPFAFIRGCWLHSHGLAARGKRQVFSCRFTSPVVRVD
jgi:hypothetical protein